MKKFNIDILPIIGMSPGNSYFKQEVISNLIQVVLKRYGNAVIVTPDIPAISTYKAMGYTPQKAKRKALPKGNNLRNRARQALDQLLVPDESTYIINWIQDIEENPLYIKALLDIKKMFTSNHKFSCAIEDTTRLVLEKSGKEILDIDKAIGIGSHYILSEFAFLEISSKLFGCNKVNFIYHRNWPAYEQYIAGNFDGVKRTHMGFEKIILE